MSQGSLLSMQGDKQISVAARNMTGMKLDIKRVILASYNILCHLKAANIHQLTLTA